MAMLTKNVVARLFLILLLITIIGKPITAVSGNTSVSNQQTPTVGEGLLGSYLFPLVFEPMTQKGEVSLVGFGTFSVSHRAARSDGSTILDETITMRGELNSMSIEYEVSEDSYCQTGYAVFINNKSTAPDGCVPVESRSELIIFVTPRIVRQSEATDMGPLPPPVSLFSVSSSLIEKESGKVVDTTVRIPASRVPGFKVVSESL
jgi:hypothetical protein